VSSVKGDRPAAGGPVRTLKIVVEYEGTAFSGFQRQRDLRTVQLVLEEALSKIFGHLARVAGAGRTDAGVHALGQVVSTRCEGSIPTERIAEACNSVLPPDVAVRSVQEVADDFHARKSATGKSYRYVFSTGSHRSPFLARYAFHVKGVLDVQAMGRAAGHFRGTHDFRAYRATGSSVRTSKRTVFDTGVFEAGVFETGVLASLGERPEREPPERTVVFRVTADGFLYNMVRIMAGTLLLAGTGRMSPDDVPAIIESGDRERAGRTLPAHGLWLWEVGYQVRFP